MDEIIKIPSSLSSANTYAATNSCTIAAQCGTGQCGNSQCGTCQSGGQSCHTTCERICQTCQSGSQCGVCQITTQTCTTISQCGTCQAVVQSCSQGCTTIAQCGNCQAISQCGESSGGSKPTAPTNFSANGKKNTIECSWTAASDAKYYEIFCHLEGQSSSSAWGTTTSTSYTITGLEYNATYVVNVRGMNSYGNGPFAGAITVTIKDTANPWSWNSSNGDASAEQTQAAHTAVTSQGLTTDFSYLVWNDMCAKVKEVREAAGVGSWDGGGKGYTYASTLMSSDDPYMTAVRFNSLKYNIGSQYSTGIEDVSSGDIIYGSYFTSLMATLNNWIDTL